MAEENVAVLVDFENINNHDHMRALLDELSGIGRITVKRAFGDWQSASGENQRRLQSLGIELIHHAHATTGKNASDIRLTADAVNLLHTSPVNIDTFVIASGDSDFFPLITVLRSHGKSVIVAARRDVTTNALINSCDRFIDLTDLVNPPDAPDNRVAETVGAESQRPGNVVDAALISSASSPDVVSRAESTIPHDTRKLVVRAIQSSRDHEGRVKGAKLHETIRRIDPSFNFRELGFHSFSDFLDGVREVNLKRSYGPEDVIVTIAPTR